MEEVIELMKMDDYKDRIIPVSIEKEPLLKVQDRCLNIYHPYWKNKYDDLLKKINSIPLEERCGFDDRARKFKQICELLGKFGKSVDEILYESVEEMDNNHYKNLLNRIRDIASRWKSSK